MRRLSALSSLVFVAVAVSVVPSPGCSKPTPESLERAVAELPPVPPVSKEEAETYGKTFAALLGPCDPAALAPLWDASVTADRAIAGTTASGDVKDGLRMALTSDALWTGQCASLKSQGESRNTFLGVRQIAGSWRPLVRMVGAQGLNYAELELGKYPDGVRAVDATYYLTGEPLSKTLARLMGSAQKSLDDGTAGDAMVLQQISEKQRAGDQAGALALIKQLPPALREDKSMMLLEIGLDPGDDEARYLAAIERFEKKFPGDPALDLVSVDGFFMRKQYDRLHGALDRLDKAVNDPYLEIMHALAFVEEKQLDKAQAALKKAIEREPDLQDAWDTRTSVCLAQKDYACAVESLKVLNDKFKVPVTEEAVLQLDGGAELVLSEPWKAWRATVGAEPPK